MKIFVRLTPDEIELFQSEIVNNKNVMTACKICEVNYKRFKNALNGGLMSSGQRDRLVRFAKSIKT